MNYDYFIAIIFMSCFNVFLGMVAPKMNPRTAAVTKYPSANCKSAFLKDILSCYDCVTKGKSCVQPYLGFVNVLVIKIKIVWMTMPSTLFSIKKETQMVHKYFVMKFWVRARTFFYFLFFKYLHLFVYYSAHFIVLCQYLIIPFSFRFILRCYLFGYRCMQTSAMNYLWKRLSHIKTNPSFN